MALTSRYDIQGTIQIGLVVFFAVFTPIAILIMLVTHLDPFYYVFEELLPHPFYRNMELIVGIYLTRVLLGAICVYDFCRFLLTFLFVFMLFLSGMIRILNEMKQVQGTRCLKFYLNLRITLRPIRHVIGIMVGGVVPWAHFGTAALLWISIRCWEFISPYVAFLLLIFPVFLSAITILVLFPEVTKLGSESESLIRQNMNLYHSRRHNRVDDRYFLYLSCKSHRAMALPCGFCFTLGKGFTMQYSQVMVDNVVNAVLLFDPTKAL